MCTLSTGPYRRCGARDTVVLAVAAWCQDRQPAAVRGGLDLRSSSRSSGHPPHLPYHGAMTASAPTLIEDVRMRAPFKCTVCGKTHGPAVLLPALDLSLEGNHMICADCVQTVGSLLGLKIVESHVHSNTREDAWERLNARNDELHKRVEQMALAIKSMAQAGYQGKAANNVYSPVTYRGFKNQMALTAHHREVLPQGENPDGLTIEQMADKVLEDVA